jgi:hypothetical protein
MTAALKGLDGDLRINDLAELARWLRDQAWLRSAARRQQHVGPDRVDAGV